MEWIIFGCVVTWLGVVSWFDIRKNEIPHSAWVIIPLIGACSYRFWQGGWALVLMTGIIAAVSERDRISRIVRRDKIGILICWIPLLFLGAYLSVQVSPIAALAIIGFWVTWELKWWGGADAVSAIAITLIWPGEFFILAFLATHIMVVIGLGFISVFQEKKIKTHQVPGIPILLVSIIFLKICFIIMN